MQVSVEKTSELRRKMTVLVPEEVIQEKMAVRMKSLASEVKLDGFRPGKVPQKVIKKMFGPRVRSEITGDLIQSSYIEALQEQQQKPVGPPSINPVDQGEGKGFEYTAEFEVYPEISLADIEQIEVSRATAEITETDLEKMIMKLREQQKEWQLIDRAAQEWDRVNLSFSGTVDGDNFSEGKDEKIQVIIGSKQMIPGFEDNLLGLEAGDIKTFTATFPEDYRNEKMAGKTAEFTVEVDNIEEPIIPEIDAEFIKNYGIEDSDMEKFRIDVKSNMERELDQAIHSRIKNAVMEQLLEKIPLLLPTALIDQEIANLQKPYLENAEKQKIKVADLNLSRDNFEKQAKRRVALGLILAEIVQKNTIKVDAGRVRATITEMAQSYERPDDVINWYYADETRLVEVQQMVLEDQAVDWVLSRINVTDETVSFDAIMNKGKEPGNTHVQ